MLYKKGADTVVADTLSRSVKEVEATPEDLLGFETLEFESAEYQKLVNDVTSNQHRLPDLRSKTDLSLKEPETRRWMMKWRTRVGGCGSKSTRKGDRRSLRNGKNSHALRRQFYWSGLTIQVRDFVRKCENCKETKA